MGKVSNQVLNTTAGDLGGEWKTYTPTFTNGTSTTKYGAYTLIGKTCTVSVRIICTGAGGGVYSVSLPFTAKNGNVFYFGSLWGGDTGTAYYGGTCMLAANASAVSLFSGGSSTGYWGTNTPFTWANTDVIQFTITYEVA
jgi:hypothetical protein